MTPAGPDYRRVNAAFTLLTEVRVRDDDDVLRRVPVAKPLVEP